MKVQFQTNIDHYKRDCFPNNLTHVPRVGDFIMVTDAFKSHYKDKNLPLSLEVVKVTWTEKGVICELWYGELDVQKAKFAGVNLL